MTSRGDCPNFLLFYHINKKETNELAIGTVLKTQDIHTAGESIQASPHTQEKPIITQPQAIGIYITLYTRGIYNASFHTRKQTQMPCS